MAVGTCEAMARGGMYDQLGGGFARYSGRRRLGRAALREDALRQRPAGPGLRAPVAPHRLGAGGPGGRETCDWMLRELRTAEGGLRRLAGRRQRGRGGRVLRLAPGELRDVLGPEDGEFAAGAFGVTEDGTFEHGASVLQRLPSPLTRSASPGSATPCWPRAAPGSARAATTRWSPRGTGWPSPRWPRRRCCSARPDLVSRGRADAAGLLGRAAPDRRPADPHLAGRHGRDTAGTLEDYACVAEGSSPCPG